ncbi:YdeI/OmpD-associated family protein [Pseudaestuariivita sp.]|uniref:YdeI/OmpD-associated family protein n=1 Tax=Pseudaestuariivita sp. TaxID=2211669 RepID=UPI00405A35EF
MITEIEDYFTKGCGRCARFATADCSARVWSEALSELRALCRDAGLTETVKWGHPCYTAHGQNIAILGAFRSEVRLSFFHAGLMADPEGVLTPQGPNTAFADALRFTSAADVRALAGTISAYLAEARGYAAQGLKPPKPATDVSLPDALVEMLAAAPEVSEAFDALTPGRRKSHALHVGSAKKRETQDSRAAKAAAAILAGKGHNER